MRSQSSILLQCVPSCMGSWCDVAGSKSDARLRTKVSSAAVQDAGDMSQQFSKVHTLGPGANCVEGSCKIRGDNHPHECANLAVLSLELLRRSDSCSAFLEYMADNATAGVCTISWL